MSSRRSTSQGTLGFVLSPQIKSSLVGFRACAYSLTLYDMRWRSTTARESLRIVWEIYV